ncbi:MAG: YdeI/OmpD-associated family protein [Acidobacteriota bacterium]
MATRKRFRVLLEKDADSEVTGIVIPFNVEKTFGTRARVPVRGTINGFEFRSSIFPTGDSHHYMVVNKKMREGARVRGGEMITVEMERDDAPRIITPPEDFEKALRKNKDARAAWEKLSYSHRKEYVKAIEEAKKPETRARRIEKAIEQIAQKIKRV